MDHHWHGAFRADHERPRAAKRSCHVTMRDGTRLAVDVHLPRDGESKRPAILRQTRYMRALEPRAPLGRALRADRFFDIHRELRDAFLASGYAWVDVDVRGTGASDGRWRAPWFDDQRSDAKEIVSWIVSRPWSNGRVGSTGISYDGTCADMLLADHHPAVRAVAPLFSLHDVYADVAFPGGLHLAWFTAAWSAYNSRLDRYEHGRAMSEAIWLMARAAANKPQPRADERILAWLGRLDEETCRKLAGGAVSALIRGVAPVDAPADESLRAKNLDVHAGALDIVFRDDTGIDPEAPHLGIDSFSPHTFLDAQRASGAAIYSYSGWRDGAYPHSAIKRWSAVRNAGSRLTIGPWAHTGRLAIHAFATGAPTKFPHAAELIDFFDEHLHERPSRGDGKPIHWFTTGGGAERWNAGTTWPPEGTVANALHLGKGSLSKTAPEGSIEALGIDRRVGTGERSRWRSLLSLVPGDYPDRRTRDRALLVYDSPPLAEAFEVTGHPAVSLEISFDAGDDGAVFAYLEDVAPDGRVFYVTEGQLRVIHGPSFRRGDAKRIAPGESISTAFELIPCSHVFARGHRVRLAIAPCDADHFRVPETKARELRVHLGRDRSRLLLPSRKPPVF